MLRTTLLSLVALGLAAQTPAPKPAAKPAAAPAASPQPAAAAVKPEAPKEDKILARIDGVAIHESEMDLMYANLNPQQKQAMAGQNREKAISSYLEFRLLVAKARRMGIDKSPDFDKKLKLSSYQLMAQELLQKEGEGLQKRAQVSDDDVKAYFEANKDAFKTPGKFNARHILVKTKGGPNGDQGLSEDDAKKKMAEIQAEFAKGGKWDDLAKKYSEDPGSKDKGGLYENINFGQFVPEFENAVKTQPLGQPGAAVKTAFGYHIIQAEKMDSGEVQPFDTVKEQAKTKATESKREKVWNEFVGQIKKEIPFELNPDPKKVAAPAKPAAPAAKPAAKKA
jgi:parvulin-like peptidyl-prolyl isomerase